MLRTHRAGKGPGGVWGVGAQAQLNRRGPGMPLVSEVGGPCMGAQQASWARVGRANALCYSPTPLVLEGPSHLPVVFSAVLPLMPPGPHGLEASSEGVGPGLRAGQTSQADWAWENVATLPLI